MRIERVDDKTVKCFLSNEDLAEYELDYKDFIEHTDRAKEIVHEIMAQATEEVGYKPPQFAFDLQIMVVPEHGLVLTFSEREQGDPEAINPMVEALKEMKRMLQEAKSGNAGLPGAKDKSVKQVEKAENNTDKSAKRPEQAVFGFTRMRNLLGLAATLPKELRIASTLYKMDGAYYLHVSRGKAAYEKYSKACIQALEFGSLMFADEKSITHLKEHGECLIEEKALKKLRG